ncbi:MAG: FimV/HubP family polar landmark protein [Methylosarcina sp.]
MKESNVRNLTKTLAVLSLLAPAGAHSLGIGGIKLHSALNQNLNAEISLVLSAGEKLSDIKVNLAPPDKFDEAGVPWNYFLSKIKFEPTVLPDGSVVVKLSSREALKEPFLGLLLEVSWPKGSLYREFSVLVDPPEVYEQATIPVVNLPERIDTPPVYTPPRETVTPADQREIRSGARDTDSYGPTTKKDTLWKIADRLTRQRGVSVEQMMIAMYKENPQAFFKENINALRLGKTLKVPAREAILKLSRKQALAEFDRQTEIWKNRLAPASVETATAVPPENADKQDQTIDNQLTLAAPSEATVSENAVIAPGQEQASDGQNTQAANETIETINDSSEKVTGNSQESDALQSKMLEMQQQLAKMQELIALKDQQIAALQNPAEPKPVAQPLIQAPAQAVTQPTESTTSIAQQPTSQVPPANQQSVVESTPVETIKPKIKPSPIPQPITKKELEEESASFYLTIGGIGFGLLAGIGWLWWRKRKIDAKTDTESMFAPSLITKAVESVNANRPVASAVAQSIDDSNIYQVDPVGESSFLSEFTPSDFDAFDTDQGEIDPVSEADVYLAYGRYQQAEDLMRQAIIEQPNRDECKLKLLEIFFANENNKAFESYAIELAAAGKKVDKGFWEKVSEMGNEICPESILFSSSEKLSSVKIDKEAEHDTVSLAKKAESGAADFDISDVMELDRASFNISLEDGSVPELAELESNTSDFDFSLSNIADNFGKEDKQQNNEAIDFDLDSLSTFRTDSFAHGFEEKSPENPIKADDADKDLDFESFDFTLETSPSSQEDGDTLAVDLMGGNDDDIKKNFSFDDDFNFNFDLSGAEEEQNDLFGVSDLTDMDEFETKLDLARAYMDMGDEVSAKEIVDQVIEKGSDEQKKMALKFFDALS